MGKIRDFKIIIDRHTAGENVFGLGDTICGVVVVHLNEPSKISKLEIDICGKTSLSTTLDNEYDNAMCDVSDEEDDDTDEEEDVTKKNKIQKSKKSKEKVKKQSEKIEDGGCEEEDDEDEEEEYDSDEWHFRDNQILWGGKRGGKKKMPIGRNEIRFEFQIPHESLPTTFEGSMGFTRYWLEASLEPTRFEFKKKAQLPFTVASHEITFNDETYLESVTKSKPNSFRICPCFPGRRKVFYSFTTDRSIYHPGDSILFSGEIKNNSKETITGKICVYQQVVYHGENGDRREERAVDCKAVSDVEGMETKKWTNSSLMIPPIPPSSISRLIDIHYAIEMILNIGDNKERKLSIPLQIQSSQVQTKSFGGFSYYCGPVPNYGKSVFGRTLLPEDKKAFEPSSYIPMYSYYPPVGL
ncbi:arrestin domain-containing protein 3-like [Antedon mediterranea]|uniref:arrestin domain-containing protein 3-like n=1 Tax=Antedon mediterranea TaxID=105859 RepID=UPI003AF6E83C